jgi:hypothetical protein
MVGHPQAGDNSNRPFGNAVVDGFDFDLEVTEKSPAQHFAAFISYLYTFAKAYHSKPFENILLQRGSTVPGE